MKRSLLSVVITVIVMWGSTLPSLAQWSTARLSVARVEFTATAVGNKVLFAGGRIADNYDNYLNFSDAIDIYDSFTKQWTTAKLSQARSGLTAISVGHQALFAGGRNGDSQTSNFLSVVDLFDASTSQWSTTKLAQPRIGMAAASAGTVALFAGGIARTLPASQYRYSRLVDLYDASTGQWSVDSLSTPRAFAAAVSVGTKVLIGGGNNDTGLSNVVDIYDIVTKRWTTANLSQARTWLAATKVGTKALFAGGQSPNVSNVVDIYDVVSGRWSTATLAQARDEFTATTVGTLALFAGGSKGPANLNDQLSDVVDIYNNQTASWTRTTLSSPRNSLVSASVGNQAFFGGGYEQNKSSDGVLYRLSNTVDIYTNNLVDTATAITKPSIVHPDISIRILGNPTTEKTVQLELTGLQEQLVEIALFTLLGQRIANFALVPSAVTETIRVLLAESAGVYLLKVTTGSQRQVMRVLKL